MRSSAPGTSRRTTARMTCCLAVLLAGATLFGVSACTTSTQSDEPATVQTDYGEMPDVVGMKPQEAWEALTAAGFLPTIERADNPDPCVVTARVTELPTYLVEWNYVDPNGAAHPELTDTEWRAQVVLGVGGLVQMPHVTLRSQTEAETLLASSGLENVTIVEQGEVDPGLNHVVEALPEEGSWVSPHSTVTLTVSSDVTVPDLIGDDPVSAAGALTVLGLVPSPAVPSYSVQGDEPMPQVVGMSVEPGEVVRIGTTVELEFDRPL